MDGRRSAIFLLLVGLGLALTVVAFFHAHRERARAAEGLAATRALVETYDLTDPALFTEARYTRHPSVADRHSAFQDGPLSPEHFPSGALVSPPKRLRAPDYPRLQKSEVRGQKSVDSTAEPQSHSGEKSEVRSQRSGGRAAGLQSHGGETSDVRGQWPEVRSPSFNLEPATGNRQPVTRRFPPLTTHHSPLTVSHEGDAP